MYNGASKKMDLNRAFSDAVFAWNTEKIKEIFQEGNEMYPDINQDLVSGPAILIAAMKKKWDMFEVLYSLNANLDVKLINNDWHLIHECVKNAPLNIISSIMDYCELDVQTQDGKTPLMIAIREKNTTVAKLLLDSNTVSLSLTDKNNENVAHYAAKYGMNEVFMYLIKEGVPLDIKNKDGNYPVDLIEDEIFKLSIPKISQNKEKEDLFKPLVQKVEIEDHNFEKEIEPEPVSLTGLSKIKKRFN